MARHSTRRIAIIGSGFSGLCLGIQLMAKAEGAAVYPMPDGPEIGWLPVELTAAASADPVFGALPSRFDAFGWHYYTYDLPASADELARSDRCNQAYRLGDAAWGIQFHADVTLQTVYEWLADEDDFPIARAASGTERPWRWCSSTAARWSSGRPTRASASPRSRSCRSAGASGADLSEARLSRAVLTGANLAGANFRGAHMPDGSVHP